MSIPNSSTGDLVAVTTQPDWSLGVTVTFSFATMLFISRTGKEQRQADRLTPRGKIEWSVRGLSLAQARAAMAQAEVEARSMCLVPFWSEGTITITSTAGDAVTIGVDPREDFFAPGQWVYIDDGTVQDFRLIDSVTDRILALQADVGAPTIGADAKIYPCRKCRRVLAEDILSRDNTTSHRLKFQYDTAA